MNAEQKIQEAKELSAKLADLISMRDKLTWHEGEMWFKLKEHGLYKYEYGMDEHTSSDKAWNAYIRDKGIPMSTVEFKIALWKKWVVELKFKPQELYGIHTRKLHSAIQFIREGDKVGAIEVLNIAKTLPHDEFLIHMRGGVEQCWHLKPHRHKATKEIEICGDCGKELKIKEKKK